MGRASLLQERRKMLFEDVYSVWTERAAYSKTGHSTCSPQINEKCLTVHDGRRKLICQFVIQVGMLGETAPSPARYGS